MAAALLTSGASPKGERVATTVRIRKGRDNFDLARKKRLKIQKGGPILDDTFIPVLVDHNDVSHGLAKDIRVSGGAAQLQVTSTTLCTDLSRRRQAPAK